MSAGEQDLSGLTLTPQGHECPRDQWNHAAGGLLTTLT